MELKIEYPDSLPASLQQTPEEFEHEARMALAVKLFELKQISYQTAAELAGVEGGQFLLALHRYVVSGIDLSEEHFQAQVRNT
ncbi:UPF0175 family protein [Thiohalorhabdus methylotrophus]|uniref:UPF0175 family protein n=1 Tax=Thiohalorhabdus methylotrophus TaxID=3242694 RepID=A0ABV4TZ30_9GAMM